MEISIVIPTFNNATMLATTLTAFENVVFPKQTELIIVDNNSIDNTAGIIMNFSEKLPVRYVFEKKQGISAAKNRGINASKGKLIIFTDDDVRPSSEWIRTYCDAYKKNNKGVYFGGPIVSEFEGPEPDASLLRFAPPSVRGLDLGAKPRSLEPNEWFVGANLALTADAIEEVGGFDMTLGLDPSAGTVFVGEESDLQRRLISSGYSAMYLPSASLRHVVPSNKCSLEHIAGRAEATGRYMQCMTPAVREGLTLRGLPLWKYRKCAERGVSAWIKRMSGRDWYPEYISYRSDLGFIKGALCARRNAGNKYFSNISF